MPYLPYEPSREVRLGLVLYGGVSLAIYINGVAREFFRATRGQGVYSLIKGLTDSDIGVDIVSGTSAGGINGVFLGFALCNQREFAGFAKLWRDLGDISKLMRDPSRNPDATKSLLDSEGYYQPALAAGFASLIPVTTNGYEFVTPVNELDLFITGTDVYGDISTVFDDSGNPVDLKNHRAIFQLKHRAGRKEPFKPTHRNNGPVPGADDLTFQSLARLARLTSAFPAAFTPVFVADNGATADTVDGRLQLWGALGRAAWFVDGGVLNNKPFTSTLHEIFYRMANREVERRLMYVEPAPERFDPNHDPAEPTVFQTVGGSLIGIPGYQSIAADIGDLNEHNSRVEQYNEVCRAVSEQRAQNPAAAPSPETMAAYTASRLIRLRDRVLEGVLNRNGRREMFTPPQKASAAGLLRAFDDFPIEPSLTLRAFDIYSRLRRLFYLTYLLREPDKMALPGSQRLLARINYWIGILDITRESMEYLIDHAPVDWQAAPDPGTVWTEAGNLFKSLLDAAFFAPFEMPLLQRARTIDRDGDDPATRFSAGLHRRIADLISAPPNHAELALSDWRGMLDESDAVERQLLEGEGATSDLILGLHANFPSLDASLYPLELVSGLKGRDVIRLTRVSPRDAQRGFSCREYSEKLAGAQFHNFGGFFKRSWRSNDLLWGRLDGLCQLIECVFTRERLAIALATDRPRRWLVADANAFQPHAEHPLNPVNLFAHAGDTGPVLAEWIERLFDPARRAAALDEFDDKRDLLIAAAQLNILREDLGDVAADAIREQMEWNLFKDPSKRAFVPGNSVFDPYVTALASGEAAATRLGQVMAPPQQGATPQDTALGRLFTQDYSVGRERLDSDIPRPVLLDIYSRGALLARNCVLTALGKTGAKIERSNVYTIFFDAPLRIFHGWASWGRRSPSGAVYSQAAITVCALLLMAVAVFKRNGIFAGGGLLTWAIFVIAPVAVLGAQAWLVIRPHPWWKRTLQATITVGLFALLLLAVFWISRLYGAWNATFASDGWGFMGPVTFGGIPAVLVAASAIVLERYRMWAVPRKATRGEIRIALNNMDDASLRDIARGVLPANVVSAQSGLNRERFVRWIFSQSDVSALAAVIGARDRYALPNQPPALVKHALEKYFTSTEIHAIAADMTLPPDNLFAKAKSASRLAELERRMADKHSSVF